MIFKYLLKIATDYFFHLQEVLMNLLKFTLSFKALSIRKVNKFKWHSVL